MVCHAPRAGGDVATPGHGAPLIVTAELPGDVRALAEKLRRQHYPPDRNRVPAHVTLFHSLPPSSESEIRELLKVHAHNSPPPRGRMAGVMAFSGGTALEIMSPQLQSLREDLAVRLHGLLSAQDTGVPRLHITIQNKVSHREARALQAALATRIEPREFAFAGLALHAWRGGPWEQLNRWPFRG